MGVLEFFDGKNILLTGVTGFLGKVVLEKILRSLPGVNKIFVLVRAKKGSSTPERFKKEVLGSMAFDRIRKSLGASGLQDLINSKIVYVTGDLTKDKIGLSPQDERMLEENVNVIISLAASIDFDMRLDEAVHINVEGPLRLLDLAKRTKNLAIFTHISTSYVNCDKRGLIEEKIYEPIDGRDPEDLLQEILAIPAALIPKMQKKFVGDFPNTYTITKNLAEKILQKRRGKVPLVIVRPSIVGCAWKEPVPGWVDTISAAGAIILLGGIGFLTHIPGSNKVTGDQIPVDFVTNCILASSARYAGDLTLPIVQIGSSSRNPMTWGLTQDVLIDYFKHATVEKRVGMPTIKMIPNDTVLKFHLLKRKLPAVTFARLSNIMGNQNLQKQARRLVKIIERAESLGETFRHFTSKSWIFKSDRVDELMAFMTPNERITFEIDVTKVDFRAWTQYYCYGLHRFVLKENVEPPSQQTTDLLSKFPEHHFSDVIWAWKRGKFGNTRSRVEFRTQVLNSTRVQESIKGVIADQLRKVAPEMKEKMQDTITKQVTKSAFECANQMLADYQQPTIRFFAWFLHKLYKQIYDQVVVDEAMLQRLHDYDEKVNGPLLLIPTHRSYIDFLIVSYLFFAYNIKVPFIAAAEDFQNIVLVHKILRSSGAFFIKRRKSDYQSIYKAIMYEYVHRILLDSHHLEFFIEGTRSRSGKLLPPKLGLLGIATDTFFDGKLQNMHILPISINYEHVLEGETFPLELLGEEKVKESLLRIIRAAKILKMNFGRIYIDFGEPISLRQYVDNAVRKNEEVSSTALNPFVNKKDRQQIVKNLGWDIVYKLSEHTVIMSTAIVAAILLMYRKGISEDQLVKKTEWLVKEIEIRGGKIGGGFSDSAVLAVKNAMTHLNEVVNSQKDMFKPSVSPKNDYKNVLLLSYYRNSILHVFANESLIACAIAAFGQQIAWQEGVELKRLWEEVDFLLKLLHKEFIIPNRIKTYEQFVAKIDFMISRNILVATGENRVKVAAGAQGELSITFLCSLVWPFIDCYWLSMVFVFSVKDQNQTLSEGKLHQNIQWFAESMYEERVIDHYESCSVDTIKNACKIYQEWNVLTIDSNENAEEPLLGQESEPIVKLKMPEEKMKHLEDHISKFQKNAFARSVNSPIDIARKSMLVDYPFMAKL